MSLGAPTKYSDELATRICLEISTTSKSLRTICKQDGMPCVATVLNWLNSNESFLAQYTRAKEEQADFLAEEMMEIADDSSQDLDRIDDYGNRIENKEFVNRSKLRVETRKWIASKLKPKKYGDRVDVTSGNEPLKGEIILKGTKFSDKDATQDNS